MAQAQAKKTLKHKIEYFLTKTGVNGTTAEESERPIKCTPEGTSAGQRQRCHSPFSPNWRSSNATTPASQATCHAGNQSVTPPMQRPSPAASVPSTPAHEPASHWNLYQLLQALHRNGPGQSYAPLQDLFNLAADDSSVCTILHRLNAVGILSPLLRHEDLHVRILSAYILSALATAEAAVRAMVSAGTINALIGQLADTQPILCKKAALRALGKIVRWPVGSNELVACGGLRPLSSHIKHTNPTIVRRSLIALYNFIADKSENSAQIVSVGAIAKIMELCYDTHPEVQRETINLVKALCRCDECRQVSRCPRDRRLIGGQSVTIHSSIVWWLWPGPCLMGSFRAVGRLLGSIR